MGIGLFLVFMVEYLYSYLKNPVFSNPANGVVSGLACCKRSLWCNQGSAVYPLGAWGGRPNNLDLIRFSGNKFRSASGAAVAQWLRYPTMAGMS
ncbi:hypothetical protein TNCV_2007831 [Trichonephila clavipes]|nr:hypothetical protein TNCV_2007831 [Trichonephila clavipes]